MRIMVATALMLVAGTAVAQAPTPAAVPQKLASLAMLDGVWRGTATVYDRGGRRVLTHTERVGPMLNGALKLIEGKSYKPDGSDGGFNAFAVISEDERTNALAFRSYSGGHTTTVPIVATADGFAWTLEAGPGITIRFSATVKDGHWHEEGLLVRPGAAPVPTVTLDLQRVGSTDWPAGKPVSPR